MPNETDFSGDWREFRSTLPQPFVARADFNGDGFADEAWLFPANAGGWGLFAYMGSPSGSHRVVRLDRGEKDPVQWYGLELVNRGQYKTACGKGYWECKKDEPEVLDIKLPSFAFFRFESSSSIYWWDHRTNRFRQTWISD